MAYSQKDTSGNNPEAPVNIIKVKVFPNPATNVVNVLGLQNCNKAEFTISDLYGNVVMQHAWEISNNALNIPISDLDSGIYILRIRSAEQSADTKFVKQ
tara:strand:+ start:107 stop:403 length:297 start_codon:yes stop_codon:yes gene_type:complete